MIQSAAGGGAPPQAQRVARRHGQELARIARQVGRRKRQPLPEAAIALRVGNVVIRFKVAKHSHLTIADGVLQWVRQAERIQREAALDGIYVVRTSEESWRCSAADAVRRYKSLAQVERAFRCLKRIDLRTRPIHHRSADHVRAHILLCTVAYYVEWHMRRALAPLLFKEEELARNRRRRDPLAPPEPSASAQRKKMARVTPEGFPVHSFDTLLDILGTGCRNVCRVGHDAGGATFEQLTVPTALQARAFELLACSQKLQVNIRPIFKSFR